jgi:molecular chaperone GrpE
VSEDRDAVSEDVTPEPAGDATDEVVSPAGDADAGPDAATEELASEIESEIGELAAERDQFKDIAQRVQADFDNYRKRVQQQIRDEATRASGKLAEAMLPVLDATEAAYLRHPDEVGPLLNLMLSELRKQGLETMHLQDQPFDPNVAEAVAHEAGDGGEVVVAEVLRSGYTWNGRTLRPAMVRTRD